MTRYIIAGAALLVYAVLAYFAGGALASDSTDQWLLRIALWVAGIAIAGIVLLLLQRRGGAAILTASDSQAAADVRFLAGEANQKLASSSKLRGAGSRLSDLPVVLVAGDGGSAKTTVVLHSGLDPELMAGRDRQEQGPPPATACANFWLGGGAVLVEAGGALCADAGAFARLLAELKATGVGNLLGRSAQAPRALVICVDAENFQRPDAATYLPGAAKRLRDMVGEAARIWANRLPVYVLFTKMDRVSYFADFVRPMTMEEAGQVFGKTLPVSTALRAGTYNQEQTGRLNAAFDELFNALTDKRLEYLRRENDASRTPNIYEFPRDFRKLRDEMVRFLVELGRPTQLQASPFLRGFFFTGVRPVAVADAGQSRSRRVPQWVFLQKFFSDALLADRVAFQTSSANTGAGASRRLLLGAAAALSLLWLGGATVSFVRNRGLMDTAAEKASAVAAMRGPATADKLKLLEELRQPAVEVSAHMRQRAPMSFRWGVYPGEPMQENVRELYCRNLRGTLLDDTQAILAQKLRALPLTPGPSDDYDTPYSNLKAYLMMTANPEKSDAGFLGSLLTDRWAASRAAGDEQARLAREQFRFYGAEHVSGYCAARADAGLVAQARAYLGQFKLVDRAYRSMVDDVNRQGPPVRFTDPTNAMSDPQEVGHAFTRQGHGLMKSAMGRALEYLNREQWVLGKPADAVSAEGLMAQLTARYQGDFVNQWNQFVDRAAVHRYAGLKDAAAKLSSLASSTSPMVRLFCLVSTNTQVENPEIARAFQPFAGFATPGACATASTSPGNQPYMQGLASLQVGVDRIANAPNPDAERLSEGDGAKMAAMTTAQQLNLGPKPAQLLKDPILFAEALLKGVPAASANGKGAGFCSEIRPLLAKFPFSPGAAAEAAPGELGAVFAPNTGRLFTFYQEALQEFLVASVGGRYIAKTDARVPVNPAFVGFFNRGAALSRLFYSGGAQMRVPFSLRVMPSPDIENVTLQIGGRTLKAGSSGGAQDFVWPDDAAIVRLQARARDVAPPPAEFTGTWAVTRFFAAADETTSAGSTGSALFKLRNSASLGRSATTRSEVPLRIQVDMKGAPATLLPRDLQLGCVGTIAQGR